MPTTYGDKMISITSASPTANNSYNIWTNITSWTRYAPAQVATVLPTIILASPSEIGDALERLRGMRERKSGGLSIAS